MTPARARVSAIAERVDWPAVLAGLRERGVSCMALARITGIPRTTLIGFDQLGVEPRHADGDKLLAVWLHATGLTAAQVPMAPAFCSAARA